MYDIIMFTGTKSLLNFETPPIGAFKCAHELRLNGFSCLVVNHYTEYSVTELMQLLDTVVSSNTLFIGFSSTFMQEDYGQRHHLTNSEMENFNDSGDQLANTKKYKHYNMNSSYMFEHVIKRHVSKINPNIKIVVGGALVNKEFKSKVFDYAVVGYAETAVVDLAKFLKDATNKLSNSYKNIYGVTIIDGSSSNGNYLLKDSTMQWLPEDVVAHTVLPIEIGRGCIFKCAFCSYPMNGQKTIDYNKNVDQIITELQFNYDTYGIFSYNIVDDTFNDSIQKLEALVTKISMLPFQPIFWCYARLDLICTHPETLDMLYKIGVRSMFFGMETLDRKSGLAIGKGYSRSKQIAMIAHIKNIYPDVHLFGSFIIGTPYESMESLELTFRQLHSKEIKLDSWGLNPLYISSNRAYGDKIAANYENYGYTIDTEYYTEQNNVHVSYIPWKNEHMTFGTAVRIAFENQQITDSVPHSEWGLRNFNQCIDRTEFITIYKQRLSEIIADKKRSLQ